MASGPLVDWLQQYVNSIGTATSTFAKEGDPVMLDVITDNVDAISAITTELASRQKQDSVYIPAPDANLERLTAEFLRRQASRRV